jgi:hypothetical protein
MRHSVFRAAQGGALQQVFRAAQDGALQQVFPDARDEIRQVFPVLPVPHRLLFSEQSALPQWWERVCPYCASLHSVWKNGRLLHNSSRLRSAIPVS